MTNAQLEVKTLKAFLENFPQFAPVNERHQFTISSRELLQIYQLGFVQGGLSAFADVKKIVAAQK